MNQNGTPGVGGFGIYSGDDLQSDIVPTEGTTIFAPTHQAANGSCIEHTMIHYNPNPGSVVHQHGFWDWCNQPYGWGTLENVTPNWKTLFVRTIEGEDTFYSLVVKRPGANTCWDGSMYNFSTGTWMLKFSSCGTTGTGFGLTGWTMWESWYLVGCPTFPDIEAETILIYTGATQSGWQYLGQSESSNLGPSPSSCFSAGTYSWHLHNLNWEWEAHTP